MVSVPIQDYHDVLNCLPEIIFKKKKNWECISRNSNYGANYENELCSIKIS